MLRNFKRDRRLGLEILSDLDKGIKRRRILPPRHGQKLHLAPNGVALNWNGDERPQPWSVFWRQDGSKTGGCHLLKMSFLSAPVQNFRARMVGKTRPLEPASDVASETNCLHFMSCVAVSRWC